MRNDDRFIPVEEIRHVAQWEFGAIETAAQLLHQQEQARVADEQQAQADGQRQQAYQEGFSAGMEQGRLAAQLEVQQQMQNFLAQQGQDAAARLAQLFVSARQQIQEAEQTLAQGVLTLACELARQVVRRELTLDPQSVMPVLKEALELLQAQHRSAQVRLHPDDVQALGEGIAQEFANVELSLRADATLQPGDCLVESAGTVVDGTLAKRWQRAVATLGLASHWEHPDEPD